MNDTDKKKIDAVAFLEMYQKVDKLKPKAFEYVNGFIDGISAAFEIAVNQHDQK